MSAFLDMGGGQILLILALILIFFGARRIPELAKGLGQGIKEFKKATREVTDEVTNAMDEKPAAQKRLPSNGTPGANVQPTPTEPSQSVPQSSPGPKIDVR